MKTLSVTPDVARYVWCLALVIGVVSSFIPAWNASRTTILESLGRMKD